MKQNDDNILKFSDISKSYNKKTILHDISLELKLGEVVGLFGPNGAGKTTFFSIAVGLLKADSGVITIGENDITSHPMHLRARMGIGYLPQESSIFRGLSVADNIRLVLEIFEKDNDVIEQKIESLLAEFSIMHLQDFNAISLSGGERRRLEIARALASKPKFIMLDEPLAGIDPIAIGEIKYLIGHLKNRNLGILITDHNVRDTLEIVDRAYVMYGGKVLIQGDKETIINNEQVKKVYLGNNF